MKIKSRLGQVWLARRHHITLDYEPYVVLFEIYVGSECVGWSMRPLERVMNAAEQLGFYESQFRLIESGRDDSWLKMRLS